MNGMHALTEIAAYYKLPTVVSYPYADASIGPIFSFI